MDGWQIHTNYYIKVQSTEYEYNKLSLQHSLPTHHPKESKQLQWAELEEVVISTFQFTLVGATPPRFWPPIRHTMISPSAPWAKECCANFGTLPPGPWPNPPAPVPLVMRIRICRTRRTMKKKKKSPLFLFFCPIPIVTLLIPVVHMLCNYHYSRALSPIGYPIRRPRTVSSVAAFPPLLLFSLSSSPSLASQG